MATIYIETHGCQMNEADSQYIVRRAGAAGYTLAERAEDASVLVLNTCTVRDNAEKRAYGRIHHWKAIKDADPSVREDLITALNRLAPENAGWRHDTEGADDMPAHIKTMLTAVSLQVPVLGGELALGTWQAIYLIEHRARPHRREIVLQFAGRTV